MRIIFHVAFVFVLLQVLLPGAASQQLYDPLKISEIHIQFKQDDWEAVMMENKKKGSKDRVLANVTLNGKEYKDVGIRFKGNSSFFNVIKTGSRKLPFNIKANEVVKGQRFDGKFGTLKLSNVFRDPSFLREILSYEIAGNYMTAPKCNFIKVHVNGTYFGLYNNTESIGDEFLEHHFNEDKGVFIKCDPEWGVDQYESCPESEKSSLFYLGDNPDCYEGSYEFKSKDDWPSLLKLIYILNNEPERIEEVMDVDKVLWMHAFNNVLVNLDSYTGQLSHNYYLYQHSNGLFFPLIWDLNLSFGAFRFPGNGRALDTEGMIGLSPLFHYKEKNEKRPLITNLLSNELYRKIYLGHMRTILHEQFLSGHFKARATELAAVIDEAVKQDPMKLYSYDAFIENFKTTSKADKVPIVGIMELMEPRAAYLSKHPLLETAPPKITEVKHEKFGPTLAINARIDKPEKVWLAYRESIDKPFTRIEMLDDGGSNDQQIDDGIFGVTLEYKPGIDYYIIAVGERSASHSPARAAFEFYTVTNE